MNEAAFLAAFKSRLPPDIFAWKINDRFAAGVPDLYLAATNGKSIWIEFKWLPKAPAKPFSPRLSKSQNSWLLAHHARGHQVAVIVGSPNGATIFFPRIVGFGRTAPENLGYDPLTKRITGLLQ